MVEKSLQYARDAAHSMPDGKVKEKTLSLANNISSMLES